MGPTFAYVTIQISTSTVNVHSTVVLPQRQTKMELDDDVGRRKRRRTNTHVSGCFLACQCHFACRGPRLQRCIPRQSRQGRHMKAVFLQLNGVQACDVVDVSSPPQVLS